MAVMYQAVASGEVLTGCNLYECMAWANARIDAGAVKVTIQKTRPYEPTKTVCVVTAENRT